MTVKKHLSALRRAWECATGRFKRFFARNAKAVRLAVIFVMLVLLAAVELMVLASLLFDGGDPLPAEHIAPVELESLKP